MLLSRQVQLCCQSLQGSAVPAVDYVSAVNELALHCQSSTTSSFCRDADPKLNILSELIFLKSVLTASGNSFMKIHDKLQNSSLIVSSILGSPLG